MESGHAARPFGACKPMISRAVTRRPGMLPTPRRGGEQLAARSHEAVLEARVGDLGKSGLERGSPGHGRTGLTWELLPAFRPAAQVQQPLFKLGPGPAPRSASGPRICSSTASCSSKEDSWAFSAAMLLRCAAMLSAIEVICAAERPPGSRDRPGCQPTPAPQAGQVLQPPGDGAELSGEFLD